MSKSVKTKPIKIKGAKDVKKALAELAPKVEKKVLKDAIKKSSKDILEKVKEYVPVKSGALKRSLKIRAGKRKKGSVGMLIGSSNKGFANTDEYYGAFLEYGTKHNPPLGFIRKAYDEGGEQAANKCMELIVIGLEKIVKDG